MKGSLTAAKPNEVKAQPLWSAEPPRRFPLEPSLSVQV